MSIFYLHGLLDVVSCPPTGYGIFIQHIVVDFRRSPEEREVLHTLVFRNGIGCIELHAVDIYEGKMVMLVRVGVEHIRWIEVAVEHSVLM